jgi:hypothetical protein
MVNPLGFLQFGPIVQLEIPMSPGFVGLAHFRLHGLGALSYLLFPDIPNFWSFAVGGGVRYFLLPPSSPVSPYIGGLAEIGYTPYYGDVGYVSEYQGNSIYLTVTFNAGYRWRFEGFLVEVGGYVGASPTVWSQWHYVSAPSVFYQGNLPIVFFAMAEVSIGWQL